MSRKLISTGSPMEKEAGYSRAVVQDNWCFVSGTTGYDYQSMTMPEKLSDQVHNCFATIGKSLQEAGFTMEDIVRVRYFVTNREDAHEVFPLFGHHLGDIRPAATLVICDLLHAEMKIEIDVTALKP